MTTREKERRPSGLPLVGLSIGTFGLGVYIAARQQKKERLKQEPPPAVRAAPKQFSPYLHAFRALGIATVIVSVAAVCTVGVTTWYLGVNSVEEFNAKMKPIFRTIRPKDFKDIDPNLKVDWNKLLQEPPQKRKPS